MTNIKYLQQLAIKVDQILKEELAKSDIDCDLAEVRIYEAKRVGVMGDKRVYGHPAEIELRNDGKVLWDNEFMGRLSDRITNEVKGVVGAVYVFATKE